MSELEGNVDAFSANYPTQTKAVFRSAVLGIGQNELLRISSQIGTAIRIMGAAGSTDYALASLGKAMAGAIKSVKHDCVAVPLCGFLMGPGLAGEPSIGVTSFWAARWHQFGMPVVRVSAEQFAALALTDITDEQIAILRAPWPAFSIALEPSALPIVLSPVELAGAPQHSGETSCARIAVTQFQGDPLDSVDTIHAVCGGRPRSAPFWEIRLDVGPYSLWTGTRTLEELVSQVELPRGEVPGQVEPEVLEKRALGIATHACLNIILAMHEHGIIPVKRPKGKRGRHGVWSRTEYVLGSPVRVNMVPGLHAYLLGDSSRTFKSRWSVRGHWRNQPVGSDRANRRSTWIAPYWKGHREAPILVKEHIL